MWKWLCRVICGLLVLIIVVVIGPAFLMAGAMAFDHGESAGAWATFLISLSIPLIVSGLIVLCAYKAERRPVFQKTIVVAGAVLLVALLYALWGAPLLARLTGLFGVTMF